MCVCVYIRMYMWGLATCVGKLRSSTSPPRWAVYTSCQERVEG